MQAVAHSKDFARRAGIPQSVAEEFAKADQEKSSSYTGVDKRALLAAYAREVLKR